MILEDVEALMPPHYDPAAPPSFEARAVRIATSAGIVRTPDRALTRSEHAARSEVPLSRALPAGLAVDFRLLDQKDTRGLVQDGRAAEGIIRSARQFNSCTRRAALRVTVVQPPQAALDAMTHEEKIRFADAQADIFRTNLDAEIIAYPYMGFGASDYTNFIARRSRRDGSCTTMFALDMQMSPPALDKVLGHLGSTRQPTIVPLRHRSPDRTVAQHLILARHLESPRMAFLACQVPRIDYIRGQAVSNLHTVSARYGYDMVALEQRRPAPSPRRAGPEQDRILLEERPADRHRAGRPGAEGRGAARRVPPEPQQRAGQEARRLPAADDRSGRRRPAQVPQARAPGQGARGAQQPARVCAHAGHDGEPAARRVPVADGRRAGGHAAPCGPCADTDDGLCRVNMTRDQSSAAARREGAGGSPTRARHVNPARHTDGSAAL